MQEVFKYQDSFKVYTYNVGVQNYLYTNCYTVIKDKDVIIKKIKQLPRYYNIVEKLHKKAIFFINDKKIQYNIDFGYLCQYNNNFYIVEVKE